VCFVSEKLADFERGEGGNCVLGIQFVFGGYGIVFGVYGLCLVLWFVCRGYELCLWGLWFVFGVMVCVCGDYGLCLGLWFVFVEIMVCVWGDVLCLCLWWKVFTARYGLIAYIKHIAFRLSKVNIKIHFPPHTVFVTLHTNLQDKEHYFNKPAGLLIVAFPAR
jgi:hypothetical protein